MNYAQTASGNYSRSGGTTGIRLAGVPAGCAGCASADACGTVRADTGIVEAGEVCAGTPVCGTAAVAPTGVATGRAGSTVAGELAAA